MTKSEDMDSMTALEDARKLIAKLEYAAASVNRFAYEKLSRIDTYLAKEQVALGKRMFEPEPEPAAVGEAGA